MEPNRNDNKNPRKDGDKEPKGGLWIKLMIAVAAVFLISSIYNMVSDSQYNQTTWSHFREAMETVRENYPRPAFYNGLNILGTHDTPRILTALGEETTILNAVHLALCLKAMKGDVQAAKYLRETAEGEGDSGDSGFALPDLSVLSDRELRALAAKIPENRREVEHE